MARLPSFISNTSVCVLINYLRPVCHKFIFIYIFTYISSINHSSYPTYTCTCISHTYKYISHINNHIVSYICNKNLHLPTDRKHAHATHRIQDEGPKRYGAAEATSLKPKATTCWSVVGSHGTWNGSACTELRIKTTRRRQKNRTRPVTVRRTHLTQRLRQNLSVSNQSIVHAFAKQKVTRSNTTDDAIVALDGHV